MVLFNWLARALVLIAFPVTAKPIRFEVQDALFRNHVQWVSDAALEKVVATSAFISGWMEVDPNDTSRGVKGEFEVDMRTFQMGPESRQNKLRDSLLSVAEFPTAKYRIGKLLQASAKQMKPGKSVTAKVNGELFVRGVSLPQQAQIQAVYFPESAWSRRRLAGNLLKVSSYFEIRLADLKYALPENLKGLIAPVLRVSADVVGTDRLPVQPPTAVPEDKG